MRMPMDIGRRSTRARALLTAALLLGSAALAGAQSTQLASADARWTPWVGCWQAVTDADTQLAPFQSAPIVCIAPTPGAATVDLVTLTGPTVGTPEHIDAKGIRRDVSREGCNGWETAQFSSDSKRIYLRSEYQCAGNQSRISSGIMTILPNGQWLDVQDTKVGSHTGVRVVHYGRVPTPTGLSAEMTAALSGRDLSRTTAVMAASDSVRIPDVIDASRNADAIVVQTWLAQTRQNFNMDAKKLSQLADAKVPTNVIDVMVALSYPQAFAINLAQANGQMIQTQGPPQQVAEGDYDRPGPTVIMDWNPFYMGYGSAFGYGMYGAGYGYGYGANPYTYGTYYNGVPIVVVRPSVNTPAPDNRGKMVHGGGYTRPSGRADGGGSSQPRGNAGSSSSGGSRTSGGSSPSGGETRTAKPRP